MLQNECESQILMKKTTHSTYMLGDCVDFEQVFESLFV